MFNNNNMKTSALLLLSIVISYLFVPSAMGFLPFVLLASKPGKGKKKSTKSTHTKAREATKAQSPELVESGHYKCTYKGKVHDVHQDGDEWYCSRCKAPPQDDDPYRVCELMAIMQHRTALLEEQRAANPHRERERERDAYQRAWRGVPLEIIPVLRRIADQVRVPPRKEGGRGRPPICRKDLFFLELSRQLFGNPSMPDSQPLFNMMYELGWVKQPVGINKVQEFLKEDWIEGEIHAANAALIRELADNVTEVSLDGTGMSKWITGVYRARKWGKSPSAQKFAKDHDEKKAELNAEKALKDFENSKAFAGLRLAVCTETRIVVASVMDVKVKSEVQAIPDLIRLMKQSAVYPKRVLADALYANSETYDQFTDDLKAEFWTPMREDIVHPKNSFMQHVHHLYWHDCLAWYDVYRRRARVEGVIGALKQRLSEHISSRTAMAIVNEVQFRVLLWNVLRVMTVYHERGVEHPYMAYIGDVEAARVKRLRMKWGLDGSAAA